MGTDANRDSSDRDVVERLIGSAEYQQLLKREPMFDLFSVVGRLTENASSRALAYLLDSNQDHGLGTLFFETLLQQIASGAGEHAVSSILQTLLHVKDVEINCTTEWSTRKGRRVDILARVFDPQRTVVGVLGIENKHGAEEQEGQVGDYQEELALCFPGDIPRLMLFLSPGGRHSRTARHSKACPHIEASYLVVAAALRSCSARLQGPLAVFVSSLANHLETELENGGEMNSDVKALVHSLYKNPDHRKAIRLLLTHLPTFGAILPRIEQRVFGDIADVKFRRTTYPKRRIDRVQEVYFEPTELRPLTKRHGVTFYYVLQPDHKEIGWRAPSLGDRLFIQLLAWCKEPAAKEAVKRLKLLKLLPPSKDPPRAFENKWFPIWSAGTHTLRDFDSDDVLGCSQGLIEAIRSTYPTVKAVLEQEHGTDRIGSQ